MKLINPALFGEEYDSEEYTFASSNIKLQENSFETLQDYDNPSPDYAIERRVDLSKFLKYVPKPSSALTWPFKETEIPLMGRVHVPVPKSDLTPKKKYPLALFCHGDMGATRDSAPGYSYLCELLASHGILSASMVAVHISGSTYTKDDEHVIPESGKRVILTLEYIKQFKLWNEQVGHPLYGRVDLDNVLLCGHSRGGESVADASYVNKQIKIEGLPRDTENVENPVYDQVPLDGSEGLGPYGFGLKAIVTLAPAFNSHTPVAGDHKPYGYPDVADNFFLLHGSADLISEGYIAYDTANRDAPPYQTSNDKIKGLWRFYGGDHNAFNTTWPLDSATSITPEEHRDYTKVYVSAIAQTLLLNAAEYREVLENHQRAAEWLPKNGKLISRYQAGTRLFLQHFQEQSGVEPVEPVISYPVTGSVVVDNVTAKIQVASYTAWTQKKPFSFLKLSWNGLHHSASYALRFDSIPSIDDYNVISLSVGQRFGENNGKDLDFTLELIDAEQQSVSIRASEFNSLLYPDAKMGGEYTLERTVQMQTIRIPFELLQPVKIQRLVSLKLTFDHTVATDIYIGDIQLSQ